ncbi:MAG: site-specific DNA-methyltransferase [Deltaproteobacteria bacterium]|nr:site-specific DNA-methyltransferase [Deltaproteobacteria bacterium]
MYTTVSTKLRVFFMSRQQDFQKIISATENKDAFRTTRSLFVRCDSLEVIKEFPDHSVSLILTDPPYHSTKKKNIYGDTSFQEDEHFLEWMSNYAKEWARILRPNGSLYLFCSSSMAGKLENVFSAHFNILAHIVWTKPNAPGFDGWKQKMNKESLRQWYAHSERVIFAEPAVEGNLFRSHFGSVIREARIRSGFSMKELTGLVGAHGKVNHGGAVSNWEAGRNVPSREQYKKLRSAILSAGKIESMPDYQDLVRPFFVDKTKEFTDIWTFPNIRPYKGKHPAEKPIALLEHAIEASTFPDDIVLDCFAGSGSTAVAALKLGRFSISLEIDEKWGHKIKKILEFIENRKYQVFLDNYEPKSMKVENYQERMF